MTKQQIPQTTIKKPQGSNGILPADPAASFPLVEETLGEMNLETIKLFWTLWDNETRTGFVYGNENGTRAGSLEKAGWIKKLYKIGNKQKWACRTERFSFTDLKNIKELASL